MCYHVGPETAAEGRAASAVPASRAPTGLLAPAAAFWPCWIHVHEPCRRDPEQIFHLALSTHHCCSWPGRHGHPSERLHAWQQQQSHSAGMTLHRRLLAADRHAIVMCLTALTL